MANQIKRIAGKNLRTLKKFIRTEGPNCETWEELLEKTNAFARENLGAAGYKPTAFRLMIRTHFGVKPRYQSPSELGRRPKSPPKSKPGAHAPEAPRSGDDAVALIQLVAESNLSSKQKLDIVRALTGGVR